VLRAQKPSTENRPKPEYKSIQRKNIDKDISNVKYKNKKKS